MYLREGTNEEGTPISFFTCGTCAKEFNICPVVPVNERSDWPDCLSPECSSYDPHRDAEVLFMTDEEIAKEKPVVSITKLRQRRNLNSGDHL